MPALNRQGLRKLSADLIDQASDKTDEQVVRLMLAFVGVAAFCLLSLASPDSALLTSNEKLEVPGAGPVSFFGFMLLGPAILIVLRIYLQIYVEHSARLGRIAQRMPAVGAPTLAPFKNPLILGFRGLTCYLLLPMTMLLFAWKAAVFPIWGSSLLCVAAGVIAGHAMLLRRISWRTRALLSVGAAILAGGVIFGFWHPRRPFELSRVNLSGAWLPGSDLLGAHLDRSNLNNANLSHANLSRADLDHANLAAADLSGANLKGAVLSNANLNHADLRTADLTGADLSFADLSFADLTTVGVVGVGVSIWGPGIIPSPVIVDQRQLDTACGSDAKLPPGLTLKPCPP